MSRTNMILSQHLSSVSHALKHLWRPRTKVKEGYEEGDGLDKNEVAKKWRRRKEEWQEIVTGQERLSSLISAQHMTDGLILCRFLFSDTPLS